MEKTQRIKTSKISTQKIVILGLFACISGLLMYVETPLPFLPPFLKLDISGVPVLIAAFIFGPFEAIAVALIKDLVHLMSTQTGGVGELADFLILASFSFVVAYIYDKRKSKKGAGVALLSGAVTIAIMGALTNKFLLIPFYSKIMPIDAIVGACNKVNPMIDSINTYIYFGVIPFNVIKGAIISFITLLVYKRLSVYIKSKV